MLGKEEKMLIALTALLLHPVPAAVPASISREPQMLFSRADYPLATLSAGEHGSADVKLQISQEGRVRGCTVVKSSGSTTLDLTTCSILKRRARFTPARDAQGRPTDDTYLTTIVWKLPG